MRIAVHESEIWLPRPRAEVFPFFADAFNLERLTPPWLRFEVVTPAPIAMAAETLIDYRLTVRGVPIRWRSRIRTWDPPRSFVDEQVRGPYRLWHHTHEFEEWNGGTLVRDRVRCAVPGGRLVWNLVVKRDVRKIFAYRSRILRELFPATASGSVSTGARPDDSASSA